MNLDCGNKMYEFAIIACARWETPYIAEWIEYYEALGFDHIYLYCNDDEPNTMRSEVIRACHGRRDLVTFVHFQGQGQQRDMYISALERAKPETEWIAFLDIDEFLVLPDCDNIANFMRQYSDVDSVHFNWQFFGHNGYVSRPTGSVLTQYTSRSENVEVTTKHITRAKFLETSRLAKVGLRFWHGLADPIWSDLRRVNVLGHEIGPLLDEYPKEMAKYLGDPRISERIRAKALVNHYVFKSEEDFLLRVQRGLGGDFASQSVWEGTYKSGGHRELLARLNVIHDDYLAVRSRQKHQRLAGPTAEQPAPPLSRISVIHPLWTGNLLLGSNARLKHELHGSLGAYYRHEDVLHVQWDKWPSDLFLLRNRQFLHHSLVRVPVFDMRHAAEVSFNSTVLKVGAIAVQAPHMDAVLEVRPGTTDVDVFAAIFVAGEYADLPPLGAVAVVVDLGANAGFSSVYFANAFPQATIVAVEPEPGNFRQLQRNAGEYPNIIPVNAAIWHLDTTLEMLTTDAAGASLGDWGVRTVEVATGGSTKIEAVSVATLLKRFGLDRIDIAKVDIEGAEMELFGTNAQEWLSVTRCVVVETHERFKPGSDRVVTEALRADFDELARRGECRVFLRR